MREKLGADLKKIRTINRIVILNTIRNEGPLSKAKIVRLTGISVPTVNRVVEELCREELVGRVQHQVERGGGRPGELFEFAGRSHFVMGIDVAAPNMRGMVADLSGEIFTELTEPLEIGNGAENYRRLMGLIERLQHDTAVDASKITGIAVGIAGVVDSSNGIILQSAITGWDNFPLARRLQQDSGFNVYLDRDIDLATLGEHGFGIGQGSSCMGCVTLGTSVFCGLVIDGEVYHGPAFNSGRLDQFITPECTLDDLSSPAHDTQGAFSRLVASPHVLEQARALLADDPEKLAALKEPRQVYLAAAAGEPWACQVLEGIVPPLATSLSNISALLNLELIVITGRMADVCQILIPMINSYLGSRTSYVPHIRPSTLGSSSTVLGAVMLGYKGLLQNW